MGPNKKAKHKGSELRLEVVDFYPAVSKAKKNLMGTLHVYLVEEEIDLRGIFVFKKNDGKLKFMMPHKFAKDEDGKSVWYPLLSFTSERKNKELAKSIQLNGSQYVKSYLSKSNFDVSIGDHFKE